MEIADIINAIDNSKKPITILPGTITKRNTKLGIILLGVPTVSFSFYFLSFKYCILSDRVNKSPGIFRTLSDNSFNSLRSFQIGSA